MVEGGSCRILSAGPAFNHLDWTQDIPIWIFLLNCNVADIMKKSLAILTFLFAFALSSPGYDGLIVHSYKTAQGMPSNKVSCIIQDRDGFIWIGTNNGLCRFDGRNIRIFHSSNPEFYHIADNHIYSLMADTAGNIWAGTKNGVFICRNGLVFEPFSRKTKYGVFPSCEITCLFQSESGKILIGTMGQGLFIYNPETEELRQDNIHMTFVNAICDLGETIYVATMAEGVALFNQNGYFTDYFRQKDGTKLPDQILSMCVSNQSMRMGTSGNFIHTVDSNNSIMSSAYVGDSGFRAIKSLFSDSGHAGVLIGTDNGLFQFSEDLEGDERVCNQGIRELAAAEVVQVLKDSEGGFWIATENKGVIYLSYGQKPFLSVSDVDLGMVNAICEDKLSGRIWIAGKKGLFFKNPGSSKINRYNLNHNEPEVEIKALSISNDELWIGTSGRGLKSLNLRDGIVKSFVANKTHPYSLCDNYVTAIYARKNGEICVGTKCGYCYLEPGDSEFHSFTSVGFAVNVVSIMEDNLQNLWISTSHSGLYVKFHDAIDFVFYKEGALEDGKMPPYTDISCILQGNDGNIWFGTYENGVFSYNLRSGDFSIFNRQDRWLSGRTVYSMTYDSNGLLCLATDAGFVHIKEYGEINYQVMSFDDGLVGDQFNEGAVLMSKEGLIYLGETNGMDVIAPSDIANNFHVPKVFISDIRLTDAVTEEESAEILDLEEAVYRMKEIKVPYNRNNLSFVFSSLSYQDPQKNRFSYKMDNVDQAWISDTKINEALYRNLRPGKYLLHVKASNNGGVWNNEEAIISIHVTPPWWFSQTALIIYAILAILSAYTGIISYRNLSRKKYLKYAEHLNEIKEKEIYQAKICFFTQVVHEIRTPLTLIKISTDSLKEKFSPEDKDFRAIDWNVNSLLDVANELLDMQKIENGDIKLLTIKTNFTECVKNNCEHFSKVLINKGIRFSVVLPPHPVKAVIDPVKISRIIVNLLGNALKYAKSEIRVTLFETPDMITLRVEDNGPGIKNESKEKIFRAFYQEKGEKEAMGTGLGLPYARQIALCHRGDLKIVKTELGGAAFELTIPSANDQTDAPELCRKSQATDIEEPLTGYGKYSILLVEDNADLLETVASGLGRWYKVFKTVDGHAALDVLANKDIDVIISDVMMPVMDGLELCRKVKGDINYSHIPVILLTAKIQLQSKLEGMIVGADVYMEKPFTIDQLHLQIENLFNLRQSFHEWVEKLISTPAGKSELTAGVSGIISSHNREFIFKMNSIIDKYLDREDFSLENFSRELGLSKSSFYRKIHSLSAMTPNEYLKNYRLGKAMDMIKKGMRINEVYSEVGFNSASYFSKCFKKKFGQRPKDFQEQLIRNNNVYEG